MTYGLIVRLKKRSFHTMLRTPHFCNVVQQFYFQLNSRQYIAGHGGSSYIEIGHNAMLTNETAYLATIQVAVK